MLNQQNNFQLGLGSKRDPKSNKDYKIAGITMVSEVPKQVFLLDELFPSKNQFSRGSCFHGETKVLTEDFSYRRIKDIVVGDMVFTDKGNIKRVNKVFRKKWQGTAYEIRVMGVKDKIIVTPEHPFLTDKGFINAKNIKKNTFLAIPKISIEADKTIWSFEKDENFLWVLGMYIAEGSNDDKCVVFTLSHLEIDYAEKIKKIMNSFGADVCYYTTLSRPTSLVVKVSGRKWIKIFNELGGKYCDRKKIASRLMFLPPKLQYNIFRGWSDGDGWVMKDKNVEAVITTSEELLWQMYHILMRNGTRGSMHNRKEREDRLLSYTIYISHGKESKFHLNNYRGFWKDEYYYSKIYSIDKIKGFTGCHVYNLEVEDDNTYIVNSVAVHNCTSQAQSHHKERQEKRRSAARFVMALTKQLEGNTEYGAFTRDTFSVVQNLGICAEELYPEPGAEMSWEEYLDVNKIPQACYDDAKNHKSQSYWRVNKDTNEIKTVLLQHKNSIVCSMEWFKEFNRPTDGILSSSFNNTVGGHAVDLIGWDDFKEVFIFKNSWGNGWGSNGLFYMPYSIFDKVVWDLWCSLDIPEDMPVDLYYGKKRMWTDYLLEKKIAFNPWLFQKIGRLPTNRETTALRFYWPFEAVFKGKYGDKWLYITFPEYQKNVLNKK